PIGSELVAEINRPFLTDYQQLAWQIAGGSRNDYLSFARPILEPVSLFIERRYGDVGFITRVGPPGSLGMLGASLSREEEHISREPQLLLDDGPHPSPDDSLLPSMFHDERSVRINALFGL